MAGSLKGLIVFLFLSFCLAIVNLAEAKKTLTIKDMAGRQVLIPERVQRIVALNSTLRFVVYLREIDKVVGIEASEKKEINNPARPYLAALRGKVDRIPIVGEGGAGRLPDFEKLISMAPDVVFTTNLDPAQADIIQQRTNIPVVVLNYGGIGILEIDSIYSSLLLLGKILKADKRAQELKEFIDKTLQDLKKRTENIPQSKKPSVYIGAVSYRGAHGITSTQGFYPPLDWIKGLNVVNALRKQGPIFIDREQLLLWNPDIIFIDTGGLSLVNEDYKKDSSFYNKLKAVKNNRVYSTLQYNNYFTNLELALANSYFIGKVLYPDRFHDIDPAKKADEISRFFVGVAIYDEIKSQTKGFGMITFGKEGIDIK